MTNDARNKDSLAAVLDSAWTLLIRGASHAGDPFNRPVLGTGSRDRCQRRTVILRHANKAERTLICFADSRSAKIAEIETFAYSQWLFYHPRKKIQLRLQGPASAHTDDPIADDQWKRVSGFGRLNFCTEAPPGTPLDRPSSGLPARLIRNLPKLLRSGAGREHFAAVVGRIASIDWLQLRPSGNLRARFHWQGDRLEASWIVP